MYLPKHFAETDVAAMHALMRAHPLATVVHSGPQGLVANHLPLHLSAEPAPNGCLQGHVARANTLWKEAGPDAQVLVIFNGPEHYISPSSYASKARDGRVVPTWTYIAVHAHGSIEAFDAQEELLDHVGRLTSQNEEKRAEPWAVTDAPEKYLDAMTRAIVGIRMRVERIEGSWKLNQHKSDADRAGVVSGLAAEERAGAHAVSAQMKALEAARQAGER